MYGRYFFPRIHLSRGSQNTFLPSHFTSLAVAGASTRISWHRAKNTRQGSLRPGHVEGPLLHLLAALYEVDLWPQWMVPQTAFGGLRHTVTLETLGQSMGVDMDHSTVCVLTDSEFPSVNIPPISTLKCPTNQVTLFFQYYYYYYWYYFNLPQITF